MWSGRLKGSEGHTVSSVPMQNRLSGWQDELKCPLLSFCLSVAVPGTKRSKTKLCIFGNVSIKYKTYMIVYLYTFVIIIILLYLTAYFAEQTASCSGNSPFYIIQIWRHLQSYWMFLFLKIKNNPVFIFILLFTCVFDCKFKLNKMTSNFIITKLSKRIIK